MGDISANFNYKDFFTEGKKVRDMACFHIPDIYQRIRNKLVEPVLQPLRDHLKAPVFITSGYRSDAYNATLPNSSPNSHHLFRADKAAADFNTSNMPEAWGWLLDHRALFCYAYWNIAGGFIHVSALTKNDRRVGRMWKIINGKNAYEPDYIPEPPGKKVA